MSGRPWRPFLGAMAWGVAEATAFFVVPDVLVGRVAARSVRQAPAAWAGAVAGGVLGAALLYQAVRAGVEPQPLFSRLPGTQPRDLDRVRAAVARDPTRAFVAGAVSGIPLKLYVAEAARQDVGLARTTMLALLNRAPRIGAFALAMTMLGASVRRLDAPSGATPDAMYALGWLLFYGWFWRRRDD